ncbi:cell wall-active antibiotics response protein LiaF [Paenibacillus solisilvae]|uniref:Cell wall-active antibiotics response protein LiaF n=1 Tax=Paenibacillus solisilvae TaxID=2486751 RepID=A0ABW0W2I0_9BACL
MNNNFLNRLLWGLFIIVIGVVLMLRQSGVIDFDIGEIISLLWPLIPLFLGLQSLLSNFVYGRGSIFGSSILMLVGFVFLGRNLGWFTWSIGDLIQFAVPFIIILFGIGMIFKPKRKKNDASRGDDWKAYPYGQPEQTIPPAPPLHPDPTRPTINLKKDNPEDAVDWEMPAPAAGTQQAKNGSGADYNPHHENQARSSYNPYVHGKMDRWERRAERVRERMEQRAHRFQHRHHDRTEWWNHDPNAQNRSGFIGDIYVGHDYWELKPMNISHFIGDTVLDLTKAQIPVGETRVHISSFIGDVKVFMPNDFEVGIHVVSSAFIGDVAVLDHKEGGIFKNMNIETPYYQDTDKKVTLVVSTFIGDVRVTKVG